MWDDLQLHGYDLGYAFFLAIVGGLFSWVGGALIAIGNRLAGQSGYNPLT